MHYFCGCRPAHGDSCDRCDGTLADQQRIAAVEWERDHDGSDDDIHAAERRYDAYLMGDVA